MNREDHEDLSLREVRPDQYSPGARTNRSREPFLSLSHGHHRRLDKIVSTVSKCSPIILFALLFVAGFRTYLLIQQTTGGGDLLYSDIPKSIMLLHGQDPYSANPWSAPYPPLLLFVVGGIIRITSGNLPLTPTTLGIVDQNVRIAGLFASSLVAIIIYATLRLRGRTGFEALIPASLFATLPAVSTTPLLYWFHSDMFGYPILALSLLFLASGRYFTGISVLAVAAIFKIHPILALPPILIWLGRRHGLKETLPTLLITTTILALGLALPFELPGYAESVLGFNLANTGTGTNTFSIFNIVYGILPGLGLQFPTTITDQVWVGATAFLFTIVMAVVWRYGNRLDPLQIVLLGVTAWMIPLKMLFTAYLIWALIPVLMQGRLRHAIVLAGLLQAADTMAYWSSFPVNSPVPWLGTVYGFFFTSLVYCTFSVLAMITALQMRNVRMRDDDIAIPAEQSSSTIYPIVARVSATTANTNGNFSLEGLWNRAASQNS